MNFVNLMFSIFGGLSMFFWIIAALFSFKKSEKQAFIFQTVGILILGFFILWLWFTLKRPPFKTMGETRIWYSFFLAFLGGFTYWHWKINYLLAFTNLLAAVFVLITICKPEMQMQALMPALQSVWFIPHVAIYMFAYAVIGCAVIMGIIETIACKKKILFLRAKCDLLVRIGVVALGIGLCLGALWAKKAWGQYWSWDIKETAALITWLIFLLYIHLQKFIKIKRKFLFIILMIGFLSLQFTWFGVKFLSTAQKSPHTFYKIE